MTSAHIVLNKIKHSFIESTKGRESFNVVIWMWGGLFYLISFIIIEPKMSYVYNSFFAKTVAIFVIFYALWHFYVSIKCAPKKPVLTKEEKQLEKMKKDSFYSSISKKLFLQEPITKMNPRNILVLLDLYIIIHYIGFIY